jgi:hypothetical protein
VANHGNKNLHLASRNIAGLELVSGSEVHPYHLLRYDVAIFSQPAIEKLQVALKSTVSKRQRQASENAGEPKKAKAPRRRTRADKAAEVA